MEKVIEALNIPVIELRTTPDKGRGLFAKCHIPRGTRIFAEQPLIRCNGGSALAIIFGFQQLSPQRQAACLGLHDFCGENFKQAVEEQLGAKFEELPEWMRKVLGVYSANAYGSLYLVGSMLNHSCTPNVHAAYNMNIDAQTFHAVRDIQAGEEICTMYSDSVNRPRDARAEELDEWGFQCGCPACEDSPQGRVKDAKRMELFELDQTLATMSQGGCDDVASLKMGVMLASRTAALMQNEGLVTRELGMCYQDLSKFNARLGNPKLALDWALKELEIDHACIGQDHPGYETVLKRVVQLGMAATGRKLLKELDINWA